MSKRNSTWQISVQNVISSFLILILLFVSYFLISFNFYLFYFPEAAAEPLGSARAAPRAPRSTGWEPLLYYNPPPSPWPNGLGGPRSPHCWGFEITLRHTHIHTHTYTHTNKHTRSVGLLRTSDRPVAETSTWQRKTLTRDRHQCPRRDSNPRPQTHALDRAANGIGCIPLYCTLLFFLFLFLILFSEFHLVCFAALNGHERKICTGMYSCYFKGNKRNS